MTCFMHCVGILHGEPKRAYTKEGIEYSRLSVIVKRSDGKNNYDFFPITAWEPKAKYVNTYLHSGDMVSIVARPMQYHYTRKDGTKISGYNFRLIDIDLVSKKTTHLMREFGGLIFPDKGNINYDDLL